MKIRITKPGEWYKNLVNEEFNVDVVTRFIGTKNVFIFVVFHIIFSYFLKTKRVEIIHPCHFILKKLVIFPYSLYIKINF